MGEPSAAVAAVAGSFAACTSLALTYPLMTITTRQQVDGRKHNKRAQLAEVVRTEGIAGLYTGLKPAVIGTFAAQGVYFYHYQWFFSTAHRLGFSPTPLASLSVASLAGCVGVLITNPVWVVVTRMQTNEDPDYSVAQAVRELLLEPDGVRSLWKGVVPALLLVSNPAIMFMVFEPLMRRVRAMRGGERVPAAYVFVIGAFAKLIATIATYPMLVIKSRLHALRKKDGSSGASVTSLLQQVLASHPSPFLALLSLFTGLRAKILQTVLNAALMFVLKDAFTPLAQSVLSGDSL